MRLVARTIRGLESLCAQEIYDVGQCRIELLRHREVIVTTRRLTPDLLTLRTADDLFVVAAVVHGVDRTKHSLRRLRAAVDHADLHRVTGAASLVGGRRSRRIDVSASFVGKRNYSRYDVEDVVGDALVRQLGVTYHSRAAGRKPPPDTTSWRVTIEETTAVVGIRLASRPLHRRAWKCASIPGTLHPPVAAAMAKLARLRPGDRVLDPCCGAGTLLGEAASLVPGLALVGSDGSPRSLDAAQANVAGMGGHAPCRWILADAGSLPLADRTVDRILVNPPWRGQVPALHSLRNDMARLWSEASRVLRPDGVLAVLSHDQEGSVDARVAGIEWEIIERIPISLFGRHPTILVATPRSGRGRPR
jgi:tRNA (guanine6-N2)-methyltransferase